MGRLLERATLPLGQNPVAFRAAPGSERSASSDPALPGARAPPGGQRGGRAPAGPRNGEEGVGIPVPELEALGAAKSPCQKYTRASQRRPSYASSGGTAHSRRVPVLPRVCSSGESRRPKRGGVACQRGPFCSLPPRPGRPAGSSQPRTCISESSRAPLLAPDARGAGRRRASV